MYFQSHLFILSRSLYLYLYLCLLEIIGSIFFFWFLLEGMFLVIKILLLSLQTMITRLFMIQLFSSSLQAHDLNFVIQCKIPSQVHNFHHHQCHQFPCSLFSVLSPACLSARLVSSIYALLFFQILWFASSNVRLYHHFIPFQHPCFCPVIISNYHCSLSSFLCTK